ncbi:MAG: hypothetical protein WDN49_26725 [Acetobacteraceae bacterium]
MAVKFERTRLTQLVAGRMHSARDVLLASRRRTSSWPRRLPRVFRRRPAW